jgi:phosphomannomutase
MKAFKAYDIRGVYGTDFTKEDVYKIGFFLPELLNTKDILVGRDARLSSDEIFEYLSKGINDAGANVHSLGLTTTPMVYWATAKLEFMASVQITASHNPPEHNGLKVSRERALPVGFDTGLGKLKEMVLNQEINVSNSKGIIKEISIEEQYITFQKQYLKDLSKLNISMDLSNGMAALIAKNLFGDQPYYINEVLDGTFPGHDPNPLNPKNIVQLKEEVLKNKSDIGVIYDGDADRVMFLDEKGEFISPDLMIAFMGEFFLTENQSNRKVLQDIRTSKAVGEYLSRYGVEMNMWRVGRAYAAEKLQEIDGLFGGELAGHYYFKDFYYSDSGIMASLIILGILAKHKEEGKTLSMLINEIKAYESSGEINFTLERKIEAMEAVCKYFEETEELESKYDFDGYRLEFKDWWLNIRPSNTEPYLRFLAEASSKDLLEEKIEKVNEIINQYK